MAHSLLQHLPEWGTFSMACGFFDPVSRTD
jgi:hypothetical protein